MSEIVPSGQGRLLTAGRRRGFPAGAAGAPHTFGNQGDGPARLLVLHAPAMDAYFEELHELWSSDQPPSREAELGLMSRYGRQPG